MLNWLEPEVNEFQHCDHLHVLTLSFKDVYVYLYKSKLKICAHDCLQRLHVAMTSTTYKDTFCPQQKCTNEKHILFAKSF